MVSLPLDLSWWGRTTLGAFVLHFYFNDAAATMVMSICDRLRWDSSGLVVVAALVLLLFVYTTILGPLAHFVLLSPPLLCRRAGRRWSRLQRPVSTAADERQQQFRGADQNS